MMLLRFCGLSDANSQHAWHKLFTHMCMTAGAITTVKQHGMLQCEGNGDAVLGHHTIHVPSAAAVEHG